MMGKIAVIEISGVDIARLLRCKYTDTREIIPHKKNHEITHGYKIVGASFAQQRSVTKTRRMHTFHEDIT